MRLSPLATSTVRPRDAWLAIAFVSTIAIGMALFSGQSERFAPIGRWLAGVYLVVLWTAFVFITGRNRGKIDGRKWVIQAAVLVGGTLLLMPVFWQHPPAIVSWGSNVGSAIIFISIVREYVDFKKRKSDPLS